MKIPHPPHSVWLILLALVAEPGCRRTAPHRPQPPLSASSKRTLGAASAEAGESTVLLERLCSALHRLPAERKSACSGRPSEAPLFDECERTTRAALKSGAIMLDPLALVGCERAMQDALRGCLWVNPGNPQGPEICGRAIVARRDAGDACRSSLECRAPLHCAAAGLNGAGVCQPPAPLGAGCGVASDALAAYTVSRGLELEHPPCRDFCALTSHKCEPVPALGSSCRASVNCGPGQRCSAGQCVARAAVEDQNAAGLPLPSASPANGVPR
ncbi:MAG TPA: dickkopf-related protein [Polyangiaceae bacterium]|nr:dickkopf-related protein [Polyangiaceae bacterium]